MMEDFAIKRNIVHILNELPAKSSYLSFLATYKGHDVTLRVFAGDDYGVALEKGKLFKHDGIATPAILAFDPSRRAVIYQYNSQQTALDLLSQGPISEDVFSQLFAIYKMCRFSKIDLSWHPENFVLDDKKLLYVSDDSFPPNPKNKLELVGIREWFSGQEGISHLQQCGYSTKGINLLPENAVNKFVVLTAVSYW